MRYSYVFTLTDNKRFHRVITRFFYFFLRLLTFKRFNVSAYFSPTFLTSMYLYPIHTDMIRHDKTVSSSRVGRHELGTELGVIFSCAFHGPLATFWLGGRRVVSTGSLPGTTYTVLHTHAASLHHSPS